MSYIGNTVQNQNYVPAIDYFNGDGSTVAFTLSRPVASVAAVQAVISNVPQNPGSAFTVSGSTITFTSAPPSGTANIYVYYTSPNTQVIQPGQGTVGTNELANGGVTAAKLASGVALANIGTGGVTPSYLSTGAPSWDSSGNLSFNSGYGSVATAYGCRAWVNFNGTGTVAIRASGNVSSITDDGVGQYRINFTNSMPDANYSTVINMGGNSDASNTFSTNTNTNSYAQTTTYAVACIKFNGSVYDNSQVTVAIFR